MFRIRTLTQRERLRQALYPYYLLTAPLRPLPNALIIGGMKCGTTTLNAWLREHPRVAFSSVKEIHFFDKHYAEGINWYRTHFPIWEKVAKAATCTIEATPSYLFRANTTAQRMQRCVPRAKLIIMLRDPVQRAISHYNHSMRNGTETRSPEVALTSAQGQRNRQPNPYKQRGLYAEQIREFLRFYDRSQLLILKSELFFRNPKTVFHATQEFLNINPIPLPDYSPPRNSNKPKVPITNDIEQHLREFYQRPNEDLATLLPEFEIW
jgi:hypothetical protein